MDNGEINKILFSIHNTRRVFLGTFAADRIPFSYRYPYAVVINTDASTRMGTHWVAIYAVNAREIEYFDSFGETPNENISKYLSKFSTVIKTSERLQSVYVPNCGLFVIYFIVERCSGKSFSQILYFLKRLDKRDLFLADYLRLLKSLIG